MEVYLDNGATTRPKEEVINIMVKAMTDYYGNPSSLHRKGIEVEKLVKKARNQVAKALGADEVEIYFTSGGTESNNLAIFGSLEGNKRKGKHIITTRIEHPSVLNVFNELEKRGYDVSYLRVDKAGLIDIDEFKNTLRNDTVLISVMYVNNEVGTIQPISEITNIINKRKNKPLLHVDAIQAFGKVKINLKKLKVDLMSISGHKIHGPKGIGALYVRKGTKIKSIVFGGNQELGIRSGTENVPGILGLGIAADHVKKEFDNNVNKMRNLKVKLLNGIKNNVEGIKINGFIEEDSAPHILNISFKGIRGEVLLHSLEQEGIYVSTGSACSSRKKSFSHVLKEMFLTEDEMEGAIRFSLSFQNTEEEIDYVIDKLKNIVRDLRKVIGGRG
ncbi:cysteine desulfurase family protein [Paramaledivibacter caminithermalis]|uniref:Cysteine desulfurase n=1 Tax=Paramaledivibacter caminithermalis (strain DSM 15212 / CIP 107654 / DViRD3) TaxID=1121301 RepID=A0A1M6Q1G3_PARC5|nr:cysteine desulfurase family protein [Paramaledivibacter caminithermalis]SHK14095.1 cysteine desulfurase [Paramaledivibacter caminithermalis DSM 15212]